VFNDSTEFVVRINATTQFLQNVENLQVCDFFKAYFKDSTTLPGIIPTRFFEKSKEMYISYHPNDGFLWVLSFTDTDNAEKWVNDYVQLNSKSGQIQSRKESGNVIYSIENKAGNSHSVTENSGLVIMAKSAEGCRRTVKKITARIADAANNQKQLIMTDKLASRDAAANIFVNFSKFPMAEFPFFSDHGWAVFDMWIKNHSLLINGLSSGIQPQGYLKSVSGVIPSKPTVENVVPAQIRNFLQLSYNKQLPLFTAIKESSGTKFRKTYGISMEEFFERVFANEIVKFTTNEKHDIVGLKIKGQSTTEFNLKNMVETASRQMTEAVEHKYRFDEQTQFSIFQAPWDDITGMVFGKAFSLKSAKYMAISSDYLFISPDMDALQKVLTANVLQQTLASSVDYQVIKDQKASSSNIVLFQQRGSELDMLNYWLSEKPYQSIMSVLNGFSYSFLWQISTDLQKPYHNIVVNFGQQKTTASTNFEWKSRLESSSVFKPVVVTINPDNVSEIVVQDSSHIVYLLNRQGRILWQKQLDGLILSDIHQVDRHKNGKLQLLFNTASTLYLLDRNGNDTERYPFTFKSPATTGLGLFDYDKNKNYRIAIPHADRTLSMIDIEGNNIEGWNFKRTDAVLTTPVQHFRIGIKDYLLLGDTLRIYILDRRGDQRIKPSELKGKATNSPFYYSVSRNRWFTSTHQGQLMSVSIDGTVRHEKLFDVSKNHVYIYADFSIDGKGNHIFVDKNRLIVADNQGKQMFTHVFRGDIIDVPSMYRFSAKKRGLGIVDRTDKKVFLFDQNGKQFPGFPKHGITPFTITRYTSESDFHLLVGHIDGFIYDIKIE
jgi:hypothetical protein